MATRDIGIAAERRAEEHLKNLGYRILERNFRSKLGEIDLIALADDVLVFVEVKARATRLYGLPEESVDRRKLHHITLAGEYYASLHPELPKSQRIDVVAIEGDKVRLIEVI